MYIDRQSCMQSMRKLNVLVPRLLSCNCDSVVMSHDVKLRCERIQSRLQAANNLACHRTLRSTFSSSAVRSSYTTMH